MEDRTKICQFCKWWKFQQSGFGACGHPPGSRFAGSQTNSQETCDQFKDSETSQAVKSIFIPKDWTFKSDEIAKGFDSHVREQLPFYDLATQAVVHIARHYIPIKGVVYDVGASTGNITMALAPICHDRSTIVIPIEESEQMIAILNRRVQEFVDKLSNYKAPAIQFSCNDALKYDFKQYDFAVCFLTFMFFPIEARREWLGKMRSLIRPGGALVVVDKIVTPPGYVGTVLRRLAMDWKLKNGARAEDIIAKELSLAGYQRPVDERMFETFGAHKFFQLGEFAGWIIERGE